MAVRLRAGVAVLVSASIAIGCSDGRAAAPNQTGAVASGRLERAGTLSVSAFDCMAWRDGAFHYAPTLTLTVPARGRAVLVQRVDFTADVAGARRLLKGVRYEIAPRIEPGGTLALVPGGASGLTEVVSAMALTSISATVFFTDEDGRPGLVSAVRAVGPAPDRPPAK